MITFLKLVKALLHHSHGAWEIPSHKMVHYLKELDRKPPVGRQDIRQIWQENNRDAPLLPSRQRLVP